MFYSLKGILTHVEPSFFVVECGGVGYKCYTTLTTQRSLPKMGQEIKVYTYVHVREDAMDIYGFATVMELNCYKMLTGVSGVGPKVGLDCHKRQQSVNQGSRGRSEIGAAYCAGING